MPLKWDWMHTKWRVLLLYFVGDEEIVCMQISDLLCYRHRLNATELHVPDHVVTKAVGVLCQPCTTFARYMLTTGVIVRLLYPITSCNSRSVRLNALLGAANLAWDKDRLLCRDRTCAFGGGVPSVVITCAIRQKRRYRYSGRPSVHAPSSPSLASLQLRVCHKVCFCQCSANSKLLSTRALSSLSVLASADINAQQRLLLFYTLVNSFGNFFYSMTCDCAIS